MKESEFIRQVIQLAKLFKWRVAHFRSVPVRKGAATVWMTPVQGDGKGFPDLILVRDRIVVAELKVGKNKTSDDQKVWLTVFGKVLTDVYTWRPENWPEIEKVLMAPVNEPLQSAEDISENPAEEAESDLVK